MSGDLRAEIASVIAEAIRESPLVDLDDPPVAAGGVVVFSATDGRDYCIKIEGVGHDR